MTLNRADFGAIGNVKTIFGETIMKMNWGDGVVAGSAAFFSYFNTPIAHTPTKLIVMAVTTAGTWGAYKLAVDNVVNVSNLEAKLEDARTAQSVHRVASSIRRTRKLVPPEFKSALRAVGVTFTAATLAAWGGYKLVHSRVTDYAISHEAEAGYTAPARTSGAIVKPALGAQPVGAA